MLIGPLPGIGLTPITPSDHRNQPRIFPEAIEGSPAFIDLECEFIKLIGLQSKLLTATFAASAGHSYGSMYNHANPANMRYEAVLSAIDTLPFDSPSDETYGLIRTQLELAGTPIGGNDLLIAAQAITLDYTLVTDNESEFAWIGGLRIENWLRK